MESLIIDFISSVFCLWAAFTISHKFWCCISFLFSSKSFSNSLEISSIYVLFRNMLSDLQIFGDFPTNFLFLISNIIPLWSENKPWMISSLLNLLRCILWPRIWSTLVNIPWKFEKSVYYVVVGWLVLCQLGPVDWWCYSVQRHSYWFSSCWKERGVLKSPTIMWIYLYVLVVFALCALMLWSTGNVMLTWGKWSAL